MKLYFTRHGKTQWNQEMRFQGRFGDSPLLPESYQEIQRFGQHVRTIPFSKIYASDALRAKNTALGINQELAQPVPIVYKEALRELGFGDLEGQLIAEMRPKYGEQMDKMRSRLDLYDPTAFGGEPIEAAIARIATVVREAVRTEQGPLLFVGHGASLTAAIQALTGKPLAELRAMGGLLNSSLSILEADPAHPEQPYHLEKWNEDSFLRV